MAATDTRASQDWPGGKLLPEPSDQTPAASLLLLCGAYVPKVAYKTAAAPTTAST